MTNHPLTCGKAELAANAFLVGKASNGTVVYDEVTGKFIYTPKHNYFGKDSFVLTVSDGKGGVTEVIIPIEVAPVNDAPIGQVGPYRQVCDDIEAGLLVAPLGFVPDGTTGYHLLPPRHPNPAAPTTSW